MSIELTFVVIKFDEQQHGAEGRIVVMEEGVVAEIYEGTFLIA